MSRERKDSKKKQQSCIWDSRCWRWFSQLSVLKRIIIIFTLNTLILVIINDVIILSLFSNISSDIVDISQTEEREFNMLSNMQVATATAKSLLSRMDNLGDKLTYLVQAYKYFDRNPQFYTSLQGTSPQLPQLTSEFQTPNYTQVGYYFLNNNSSFIPLPYIDELLSRSISTQTDISIFKRINVYTVNKENPLNLSARTLPAVNTFTVPNSNAIIERFSMINQGQLYFTAPYTDILTTAQNSQRVIALRTVILGNQTNIYLQIELPRSVYSFLQKTYYFSSSQIIVVHQENSKYNFYTLEKSNQILSVIDQVYPIGHHSLTINGISYQAASLGLTDMYQLGQFSLITNNTDDPVRCIVIVQASQTGRASDQIEGFLANQQYILQCIEIAWSFVIILSTLGLAAVVGNHIFSNLQKLSQKMGQYIRHPQDFHFIMMQLKQLSLSGILKQLSDNLIAIIQKIEVRKRQRKDRISQNYHPMSVGDDKFQERQQLNDYQIIQNIRKELRQLVEQQKKQKNPLENSQINKQGHHVIDSLTVEQNQAVIMEESEHKEASQHPDAKENEKQSIQRERTQKQYLNSQTNKKALNEQPSERFLKKNSSRGIQSMTQRYRDSQIYVKSKTFSSNQLKPDIQIVSKNKAKSRKNSEDVRYKQKDNSDGPLAREDEDDLQHDLSSGIQ